MLRMMHEHAHVEAVRNSSCQMHAVPGHVGHSDRGDATTGSSQVPQRGCRQAIGGRGTGTDAARPGRARHCMGTHGEAMHRYREYGGYG
jgi:hypothetical protein